MNNGKQIRYVALDARVLAVAVEGSVKDWSAYIGAVDGHDHDVEFHEVRDNGAKLPYEVAKVIFPDFDKVFRWRR